MTKRLWNMALALLLTLAGGLGVWADTPEEPGPTVSFEEIFVAAPDGLPRQVAHSQGDLAEPVAPGSVVYFSVERAARAEDLQGMRALTGRWNAGEEAVETPRVQYRMVYDADGQQELGYRYVVALPVRDLGETQDVQVAGRLMVGPRWLDGQSVAFSFWVRGAAGSMTSDTLQFKERHSALLELDTTAGELLLQFAEAASFAIDAQGQGPIDVGFSTEPLGDVALRYPEASLRFLCWEQGPIFVREGELLLYASPDERLYEITPLGVTPLAADYDPGEGAYRLTTRRLGCYLFAGEELGPPQPEGTPENPLTNGPNGVE